MVIGQWDEYSSNCLRGSFKADHVGISENQVSHSSLNPLGWGQDPPRSQDHQIQKLPLLMEPDKLLLSDSNWLSAHDPGGLPQLSPKEISYTVMDCTNVVQTELFVIHQFHETGAKKVGPRQEVFLICAFSHVCLHTDCHFSFNDESSR